MTPGKTAIVDRLLPLLEAFGLAREEMRAIRRSMRSHGCTGATPDTPAPCYHSTDGRTPWCANCREHDILYVRLMQTKKLQTRRMQQIERLAIRFAAPEPEPVEEPKVLLEMMHSQDA